MLSSLTLKNFKPFENQSFSLKPLTLLTGLNSTGKSSVLQSLLLLRQSCLQDDLLDRVGLVLNGDLVSIGTGQDVLFKRAKEDVITLEIGMNNDIKGTWIFDCDRQSDIMRISTLSIADAAVYNSGLFNDNFHYLKAERIAPRNYFQMSDFKVRQHQQIGTQGEFTAHFLAINEYKKIPHNHLSNPSAQSDTLKSQVEAWLGEISPGTRIDNDCKCNYQKQDVSSSSLAGAAKLPGILISLQNNPNFIQENIEVEFQEGTSSLENRSIKNLTEIKHAKKICPRYKLHSKHDPSGYWKNATPMNLTNEEAQKVLNCSVGNSNENSEKRYGFHKQTDQFYVFHSDNTFDEQGYPTYHGFPIPENQVPPKILIKIKR